MRPIQTVFATLSLVAFAFAAGPARAADPADQPAAAKPAEPAPAPTAAKITKSRSNIQNNRSAAPPAKQTDSPAEAPTEVVKTKTKSNQSND